MNDQARRLRVLNPMSGADPVPITPFFRPRRASFTKQERLLRKRASGLRWYHANKERVAAYKNGRKDEIAKYMAAYRKEHPKDRSDYFRQYYSLNREERIAYNNRWRDSHREEKAAYGKAYNKKNFLPCLLRTRLNGALRLMGAKKTGSHVKELGCSIEELRIHLERLFSPGMSWKNHGEWHVDHIIPLSSFDLEDPQQLSAACHFSNLQPLWKKDNLSKGAKIMNHKRVKG